MNAAPPYSPRYSWYVVAILMVANVASYVDRQILALLIGPIKRDLALSDTQFGLLHGLSFAIFFTLLGFPIARLADRGNRVAIISWGVAVWSLMTAACGLARTFVQLALARVGVGVGEAALGPPAISLLADYFPRHKLARAVSVYGIGIYLGSGLAYLIGGQVVQWATTAATVALPIVGAVRPWQLVFLVVGLPGLLIALLMLTIREPVRSTPVDHATVRDSDVIRWVRDHRRAFLSHTVGYALFSMVNFGTATWLPAYLMRVHEWSPSKIGLLMGGATMTFGVIGINLGGWLADRLLRQGLRHAKLRVGVIGSFGALASAIPLYLARSDLTVVLFLIPLNIFSAFPFGAAQAALQEMSSGAFRARITAGYLFVNNLIGFTLGPWLVAVFTDYVFRDELAVGYSILIVAAIGHLSASALLGSGGVAYGRAVTAASARDVGPAL
jgi:MFS family permease